MSSCLNSEILSFKESLLMDMASGVHSQLPQARQLYSPSGGLCVYEIYGTEGTETGPR